MISGNRLGDSMKIAIDNYIATLTQEQRTFEDPQQRIDLMRVQGNVWIPQIYTVSTTPQNLSNLPAYSIFIVTVGTNNIVFNMEDAAACQGCIVEFIVDDTNIGKITIDGYNSQLIDETTTFELFGFKNNYFKMISDGFKWIRLSPRTWKYVKPISATGWPFYWGSFSGTTFSSNTATGRILNWQPYLPIGASRVKTLYYLTSFVGWMVHRANGDNTVPDNPHIAGSYYYQNAMYEIANDARTFQIDIPCNQSDLKTELSPSSTSMAAQWWIPFGYLQ